MVPSDTDSVTTKDSGDQGLAIEVSGLRKAFGRTPVLRNLDLAVPWGQVLTVLGPNGSGKTTLIRVLSTLMKPDGGEVRVAGVDVSRFGHGVRRTIGVVTHDSLLYEDLTAYENLRFYARMFGLENEEERIASVAAQMGVSRRLDQRVRTLSHGMQKRVSVARALLHEPRILLMDEPESGLDQEALSMLEEVIADRTDPFRTVLMTTHNLERGLAMGHRMAILANGRVAYEESLDSADTTAVREAYFRYTGAAL